MRSWINVAAAVTLLGLTGCFGLGSATDPSNPASAGDTLSTEPTEFSSADGRYTISMPGEVSESTQSVPTALGELTMFVAACEISNDQAFMVMYADYPSPFEVGDIESFYDSVQSGAAGPDGEIVSEKRLRYNGMAGREAEILKEGMTVRCRYFLRSNRLYQVMAIASEEIDGEATYQNTVKQFFNSFEVN
jgi:hypothetical protein